MVLSFPIFVTIEQDYYPLDTPLGPVTEGSDGRQQKLGWWVMKSLPGEIISILGAVPLNLEVDVPHVFPLINCMSAGFKLPVLAILKWTLHARCTP